MRRLMVKSFKIVAVLLVASLFYVRFFPIPTTLYMIQEARAFGQVQHDWVAIDALTPQSKLAFLAAEDANFCHHNGVEWALLWQLAREGGQRGGSTITQQMVKNVWLWQGETRASRFLRKGIEIPLATVVDLFYSKQRILELYLNSIEYDTAVFGIEAAAQHHYGLAAADLGPNQAARLAAVLPSPKTYQAVPPTQYIARRARTIEAGARDLLQTGKGACVL